jgi:hypothetical protein
MNSLHEHTYVLVSVVLLRQEAVLETKEGQLGLVSCDRRADFRL